MTARTERRNMRTKRKTGWRMWPKYTWPICMTDIMAVHVATRRYHISKWYIRTPRLRRIRLQDFKGRLYLVGGLGYGIAEILPFECTVHKLVSKCGFPIPA